MSGHDEVRIWKNPDERGEGMHPAGDIDLDHLENISGGRADETAWPFCNPMSWPFICPPV